MQTNQSGDVFYGVYHSGKMSIYLENADPFYRALKRVAGVYIVPRSILECWWGGGCGLIQEYGWRNRVAQCKYVIYIADDLSHSERLVTIAHELIHLILAMQGFSFGRQPSDEQSEAWIDDLAKRFYQRNPGFLHFVYVNFARIAG